jgi:hypothetical protein
MVTYEAENAQCGFNYVSACSNSMGIMCHTTMGFENCEDLVASTSFCLTTDNLSCSTHEICGEIVSFEGFYSPSNDAVMGFKLTSDSSEVYDFGTVKASIRSNSQLARSSGVEAINGAIVGMDANSVGFFMYFGFRLEYHDYVHSLEEKA